MREKFSEKYSQIARLWSIEEDLVLSIISRYEKLYLQVVEDLGANRIQLPPHFKDRRTDAEYVYDIMDGWLMEDIICHAWLRPRLLKRNPNMDIKVMGSDSDRVIQKYDARSITTLPDLIYSVDGIEKRIELQMARRIISRGYDMKEGKVKRAIQEDNIFLWILIPTNQYFIIDSRKELTNLSPIPNPLWGGKMVYHIDYDFIAKNGGLCLMNEPFSDEYILKLGV